ncbi:aminotransferase class I/II-fold pyridoxal phosphate-dependent enzyme [Candidatus Woesearchaeota archaeon]|nr:aminotransferase class I/II-fold pyridoxal phosphate-dependent enzyme [Candidatus Woesearchaeota archaeon]
MLNKTISAIKPSATLAISAKAKQMKRQGKDVVIFAAGEPDFDTPDNIKDAAVRAIEEGKTKYTPASGLPELKQAVCDKFKRDNDVDYIQENVIISNGGKHVLSNIARALLDPGDEVIVPQPIWLTYPVQVQIAGGRPIYLQLPDGFKLTADAVAEKVTEKTKYLILNTPCNPTGAVIDPSEIRKIAELALEKDFMIVADEVYEHFLYDGKKHLSAASISEEVREKILTVNAVSKSYSMTGWRIGYVAGPADIIKAMSNLQSQETSNPCSIAQHAAVEALTGPQDSIRKMVDAFRERRKIAIDGLNSISGIRCYNSEGAFYAWFNIQDVSKAKGSMDFAEKLLDQAGVAVIPGAPFGGEGWIRLSYASAKEDIEKGLERIRDWTES